MYDNSLQPPTGRWRRIVAILAVVTAMFLPVVLDRDGLPLSTYPMYASARSDVTQFVIAQGIDRNGNRLSLSLGLIGQSDDPLVVAGELRADVRSGLAQARCNDIATRVAAVDRSEVLEVEVVSERHLTVSATLGEQSLLDRVEHARCEVVR